MTLVYGGELSIGGVLPGVSAALSVSLADIQARVDALLAWHPGVIDFGVSLSIAAQMVVDLKAAIALGITPPSIDAQIAIIAALLATLEAQLQILLNIEGLLLTAGVHLYIYDGTAGALGGEVTTALSAGVPGGGGSGEHCNALVLVTTLGVAWTAMGEVFKTS